MGRNYLKGLAVTLLGVLILSPDALLLEMAHMDAAGTVFWRGFLFLIGMLIYSKLSGMKSISLSRLVSAAGVCGVLAIAMTFVTFPIALVYTSAANTLIIASCTPMFSAMISSRLFGVPIPRITKWVIFSCICGVVIIMGNSVDTGNLFGDLIALGYALSMAVVVSILNHESGRSMGREMFMVGAVVAMLGAAPFIDSTVLQVLDLGLYFPYGLLLFPVAMLLIKEGASRLGAPEVGLILLLEALFGPLWVWVVLNDSPSMVTLTVGSLYTVLLPCIRCAQWRWAVVDRKLLKGNTSLLLVRF
ncbi:MAG: DMT family transporter [Motiliproteus sp.]